LIKELWEKFRERVSMEKGPGSLGEVVEDVIMDYLCEIEVAEWLEEQLAGKEVPAEVVPVKPRAGINAAEVLRAMRE